ncbi:hypothetical protein [Microbacterium sp. zg-YB36]|uniref:hypothetical protein n=1 Tax=Microbacterium sp. zg-YB36 TaxID=2969407 RepID=UPI00214CF36C|nr:hypothetical protein [Microbacterium sp. zg-YB36]MDL5351694.1 hypothetical protein [Microbacterium sp. zg-YB36]
MIRNRGIAHEFQAWWAPASFGDLFRSLSMFDPDFARAFVDGRIYGEFSHAEALSRICVPILLMHARWMRLDAYGLVGAMDDDDVRRATELAPQTQVWHSDANHVILRYPPPDNAGCRGGGNSQLRSSVSARSPATMSVKI